MLYHYRKRAHAYSILILIMAIVMPIFWWQYAPYSIEPYTTALQIYSAIIYAYSVYIVFSLQRSLKNIPTQQQNNTPNLFLAWGLCSISIVFLGVLFYVSLVHQAIHTTPNFIYLISLNLVGAMITSEQSMLLKDYQAELTLQTQYKLSDAIIWLIANLLLSALFVAGHINLYWLITAVLSNTILLQARWLQQTLAYTNNKPQLQAQH